MRTACSQGKPCKSPSSQAPRQLGHLASAEEDQNTSENFAQDPAMIFFFLPVTYQLGLLPEGLGALLFAVGFQELDDDGVEIGGCGRRRRHGARKTGGNEGPE